MFLSYNIKDPGVGKRDPSVKHIKTINRIWRLPEKESHYVLYKNITVPAMLASGFPKKKLGNKTIEESMRNFISIPLHRICNLL